MHLAGLLKRLDLVPDSAWDCHLHGWIASKTPCIRGGGPELEQDYTPQRLEPLVRAVGIRSAVIVQAVDPHEGGREEAERLISWVRTSDLIVSAVVSANLEAGTNVEGELEWLSTQPEVIGIRIIKPQDVGTGTFSS